MDRPQAAETKGSSGNKRRALQLRVRLLAAAGALLAAVCGVALHAEGAPAAATPPQAIALGFQDGEITQFPRAATALELARARRAGATVWGLGITWAAVAPTRPPSLAQAANPAWSGYHWTATDSAVRALSTAGLQVVAVVDTAPAWAEGPGRPATRAGPVANWRPSDAWYGAFATALLRRYSGTYPDPLHPGRDLPPIRDWQPWNEPNLDIFLLPQWKRVGRSFRPASPAIYRRLLNTFYAAARRVAPQDVVAAGATAPFGDPPGGARMPPALFWRTLLCVTAGPQPVSTHCHAKVHFDAISHHPYPVGPPTYHAVDPDDVSVPDLSKITDLIPVAESAGTVTPAGPKPLWITEISWDTHPSFDGLSFAKQARYLEGAIDVLYHEGASMFIWFNLRDEQPNPPSFTSLESGVYTRGRTPAQDAPKPSLTAFEFPFAAYRTNGVAQLWGLAPAPGPVTISEQQGSTWVTVAQLTASAGRIFSGSLVAGPRTNLRATSGGQTSLAWRTS